MTDGAQVRPSVAVIGSGIAGLATAWMLHPAYDVTVFEARERLGGHIHTVPVTEGDRELRVDTGFIVFNETTYPNYVQLLKRLGIGSRPAPMSFSVRSDRIGLEYQGSTIDGLFAQRRNLVRPAFLGMVRDILRFHRDAERWLERVAGTDPATGDDPTMDDFMDAHGYGEPFRAWFMRPLGAALWSAPLGGFGRFPARFVLEFMRHHRMLQVNGRPIWRVVDGGSDRTVAAIQQVLGHRLRTSAPITSVTRGPDTVQVRSERFGDESFDEVVFACHADQALRLLTDPAPEERDLLGAFPYQTNEVVLHTDASLLPRRRRAWAAWNAHLDADPERPVRVTYSMNILQSLEASRHYCVTLNDDGRIDDAHVIRRLQYAHPQYSTQRWAAQQRHDAVIRTRRTSFCGAYWGYGFHEDAMRSAVRVAAAFGRGIEDGLTQQDASMGDPAGGGPTVVPSSRASSSRDGGRPGAVAVDVAVPAAPRASVPRLALDDAPAWICHGWVRHRRTQPIVHGFTARVFQMLLDLDRLDEAFRGRWLWSARRPALAWFRRTDHLGDPNVPLAESVRALVAERLGRRPEGRIRLLTNLRHLGIAMNPVSFYYCDDPSGDVDAIVAEVHNTPWNERHCYVVDARTSAAGGGSLDVTFDKVFHVSPFMPMEQQYRWQFAFPPGGLMVHMRNLEQGASLFDATTALEPQPVTGPALAAALLRHPCMTASVLARIYWNALRLKMKGAAFHAHPRTRARTRALSTESAS